MANGYAKIIAILLACGVGSVFAVSGMPQQRPATLRWYKGNTHTHTLNSVALGNPRTKFIVYSRTFGDRSAQAQWTDNLENRFPQLKNRIITLQIDGDRPGTSLKEVLTKASFRNPDAAALVKSAVRRVLDLQ